MNFSPHLLMKQLMSCLRMAWTFSFIFSFSATSIWATLATESTLTLDPNTLILSVSMGVLAKRILAFSILLGWPTPMLFSRMKPGQKRNTEILTVFRVGSMALCTFLSNLQTLDNHYLTTTRFRFLLQ